jgi:hypothetical protein
MYVPKQLECVKFSADNTMLTVCGAMLKADNSMLSVDNTIVHYVIN